MGLIATIKIQGMHYKMWKNCGVIIAPVKTSKKEGVKMFITHLLIVAGSVNQAWSSSEIRK